METKVAIEGKPLSQEDFKKLEETQKQVEEIDTDQEEKDIFVFVLKDSVDIFNCFALLFFSIIISTILTMVLSAALLAKYGNIRKDICYPIQRLNQVRMLSNGENTNRKKITNYYTE
jgi:hypothetical protein